MYRKIVGLAKDTLIYGFGAFANTAISVLLLPVYGRYLTHAEYGAYSVLRVSIVVLAILYDLGISSTLVRFYFDEQADEDRRRLFGTAWVFSQVVALAITAALLVLASPISALLVGEGGKPIYVQMIALQAFFATGIIVPQTLFRARRQPWRFSAFSFANVIVMIATTTYFVVFMKMGLTGALLGMLVSAFVFYVASLPITLANLKVTVWKAKLGEILAFSLPLVPHALAGWVLNFADRLLLRRFVSLADIGVYSYGYNIGMIMSLLVLATQKSWPQFVFSSHSEMEESSAKTLFSRTATYYWIFLCIAALAVAVFAPELLALVAGGAYASAAPVVPVISMAYLFLGLYTVVGVGIGIMKKSKLYFLATGTGAAANISVNLLLIPRLGIVGAAVATVAAYAIMTAVILVLSQRLYYISYETVRMAVAFLLALAAFYASTLIDAGPLATVALKLSVVLAYMIALVVSGVVKRAEIARVRKLVFGEAG
ncbi:MAG: hypothetical protein C4521_09615 [Actinobacteria bacterium]|nr:MAG: hypothetical protein C4521_09615 [Actinomycetota bacterium]